MTNTIHPWTMYEIARSRDEERLVRAQAARLALRTSKERSSESADASSRESISWFHHIRLSSLSQWAQAHHLRPHHARHV